MSGLQGHAAEEAYVRALFAAGWKVDGKYRTPIEWPNAAFSPPETKPWVRFSFAHTDASRASIGDAPIERYDGFVLIETFVPAGQGTAESTALVDAVDAIYREHRGSGVRFFTPRRVPVGRREAWFKVDVLCPYQRDTIFT